MRESVLDFRGKTVLVTGATRGIGAAIAEDFRLAGADLLLTGTNPSVLDELAEHDQRQGITNVRYLQVEFTDPESTERFLETLDGLGRIDVCINNAGTNRINPVAAITSADFDSLMQVNLRGPFLVSRHVSSLMLQAGYGRIVNIASIWSVVSKAGRTAYATAKSGVLGLTRTMAVELGPHNVLVNAVSPGFILTDMTAATLSKEDREQLATQIPMQRFAEPSEVAKVVLFLASDLNTYITGQNIVVDGGFVAA